MTRRTLTAVLMAGCVIAAGCRSTAPDSAAVEPTVAQTTTEAQQSPEPATAVPSVDTVELSAAATPTPVATDAPPPTPTPRAAQDGEPEDTSAQAEPVRPTPPPDSGAESTGPLGETELDVETGDGTVQIGSGDVPAGLRDGFPLPSDFQVQIATETGTDLGFSGTTQLSLATLATLYSVGLPASGYEITDSTSVEDVLVVYSFTGFDTVGQVAVSETPGGGGWTVLVTVAAQETDG